MRYVLVVVILAFAVACAGEWRYLHPKPESVVDAIAQGDPRQVKAAVEQSANLNALGWCGRTPLQMAAWAGDMASLDLLLEHGAGPNVPDEHGYTALSCAATRGDIEVMQALLRAGADVNWRDESGRTPLADAIACMGTPESIQFLLDHGADPNTVAGDGWTPLHQAALRGDVGLVKMLLKAGARPAVRDLSGKTALSEARHAKQWSVVRVLFPLTPRFVHRHQRANAHLTRTRRIDSLARG